MQVKHLLWFCALAATLTIPVGVPDVAFAQFNPEGRQRQPVKKPRTRAAPKPKAPPRQGPSTDALIKRYKKIVLAQPSAQFPLQRLAQLYRERDGNLEKLIQEFEELAADDTPQQHRALIALAGVYKQAGEVERALATYERAVTAKPDDPVAQLAIAHALKDRGDKQAAKERFEQALPLVKTGAEREQVLRALVQLSLDLKNYDAAEKHHEELVRRAQGSFYVRGELGRELMLRGEYQRAVEQYEEVVKYAAGDNRVLAPALRDLGEALAKAGKPDEALKTLRRAQRIAGANSGVRREILTLIAEVYRTRGDLRELIVELEGEGQRDFGYLKLLGGLYEETGQLAKALDAYQRALQLRSSDLDTRLRVVKLLQIQGELAAAIEQYEKLIAAAPRNPDFVFQLAEALIQRGEREKALRHLTRLEARSGNDPEVLAALVDFYERVQEQERAFKLLQRLARSGSDDPRHLIELGNRYWDQGDKEKAERTWQRLKTLIRDQAQALKALGEVYLEHDMVEKALEAFEKAVKLKPDATEYQRAYALALERVGSTADNARARSRYYEQALSIWEELLRKTAKDPHRAREARQHMVTLYGLSGDLADRVRPLERRLQSKPPELEAGRLLAEVLFRLRRNQDAERALRKVLEHAPGDAQSLARLEQALVRQGKLDAAIEVLERLVKLEPRSAPRYYQRMAKYAGEQYKDDKALHYAARAVQLNPEDAEGHKKLGEMYRQRQQTKQAISAFRQAIAKNDRLFTVYLELAQLLLGQGELDEADKLLRRVIRASPDENLVAQAARLSMQLNLGRGSLENLEKDLFSLTLGHPERPLYRRLLVEIYGAIAFPLVHQAKGDDQAAAKAQAALKDLGERAVKPLLDALNDPRDSQQQIALELLMHIENPGAGPALFAYAAGSAKPSLRTRAMMAVGELEDPSLLPKLKELLLQNGRIRSDESDPIIVTAAWAVAKTQSPRAIPLLKQMLNSDAPSIRAIGALGLASLEPPSVAQELMRVAESTQAGPLPRAAAAFALGELGAEQAKEIVAQLGKSRDVLLRGTALVALARLNPDAATSAVADALVAAEPELRAAGVAAASVLATGEYRTQSAVLSPDDRRVDVRSLLNQLRPTGYSPHERARALLAVASALQKSAVAAVQSSPERARAVADALMARQGAPAFGHFTEELEKLEPELRAQVEDAADQIAAAVVEPFALLVRHPSPEVRTMAVELLSSRDEPAAQAALRQALRDSNEGVQSAAISAAARHGANGVAQVLTELLASNDSTWPVRMRAASALSNVPANEASLAALSQAAQKDEYALVREAALEALHELAPKRAAPIVRKTAKADPEPRLRQVARSLLERSEP